MDMDISMDIHAKSMDMNMDMDGKFHIHGNPVNTSCPFDPNLKLSSLCHDVSVSQINERFKTSLTNESSDVVG